MSSLLTHCVDLTVLQFVEDQLLELQRAGACCAEVFAPGVDDAAKPYGKGRSPEQAEVGSARADGSTPFRAEARLTTDNQRASSLVITCGTASVWLWIRIAKTMIG